MMGHLPWLGIYMGRVPFAAGLMKQLLDYGEERATIRIKNGSLARDLFHYLVSATPIIPRDASPEERRRVRTDAACGQNNEDGAEKTQPPLAQGAIDGALAIVAGSDTTSCVLTNIVYCLMTHPETYERLQAEVDMFFPPGEDAMDTAKHPDMPYLNAVMYVPSSIATHFADLCASSNETMRLYPPLPSGSQRATTRETGPCMAGP